MSKSSFKLLMREISSDEDEVPCLSVLRTADDRIAEFVDASKMEGNDRQKIKSKRGGAIDILVSKKVAWLHDTILVGPQTASYL